MKIWEGIKYNIAVGFIYEGIRRTHPDLPKDEAKKVALEEVDGIGVDIVLQVMRDMRRMGRRR